MNLHPDGVQAAVVAVQKFKRVYRGVRFTALGLILASTILGWMMGNDFWGPFIRQLGTGAGLGILLANMTYGLALGIWDQRSPTPVR